jgi:uncharacterized protein (TIGR00288 family)
VPAPTAHGEPPAPLEAPPAIPPLPLAPPAPAAREAPAAAAPRRLPPAAVTGESPAGEAAGEAGGEAAGEAAVPEKRGRRRNGRGRGGERAEPRPASAAAAAETRPRGETRREDTRPPLPLLRGAPARDREVETIAMGVPQIQDLIKEILVSVPERPSAAYEERKLALFCDLENVALGARDSGINFDINLVLERLLEKGKIIVKKAYADWNRYGDYKRPFHEAGIELIDIPQRSYSGKNSADIKMVVDAMDISYAKEHLDTFVLLSGDSDFSPLVSKLKENDKYVIGVGVKGSSSNLLIDNCDEFIYYEDIWRDVERVPKLDALPKKEQELFGLLIEAIVALTRENKDVLWGSMIKQTMQRKRPSFSEGYYGYSAFSELLEDAERKNIVKLKKDQRSGSYIVTGFARRR